jgi:hypothetical protein
MIVNRIAVDVEIIVQAVSRSGQGRNSSSAGQLMDNLLSDE